MYVYISIYTNRQKGDVLEDNVQALGAPDKAIVLDNVGVVQVLEQVNLHLHVLQVCGAQVLEADLLDGDGLAGAPVEGAVDAPKGALAQTVAQLVVLEAGDVLGGALGGAFSAGALLALAGLAIVGGRGRGLLCVAGGAGAGAGGLRGARVGGRVRGSGRVCGHVSGPRGRRAIGAVSGPAWCACPLRAAEGPNRRQWGRACCLRMRDSARRPWRGPLCALAVV